MVNAVYRVPPVEQMQATGRIVRPRGRPAKPVRRNAVKDFEVRKAAAHACNKS
jgi:hypothetical protein